MELTDRQRTIMKAYKLNLAFDQCGGEYWFGDQAEKPTRAAELYIEGTKFLEEHPPAPRKWRTYAAMGKKSF